MTHPLIIIGAGLAGWTTVREFRKLDPETPVVMLTADSGDFYAKPSLSNAYAQKRTPQQLVTTPAAKMAETLNVTLMPHARVEAIDPAGKSLHVIQGAVSHTLAFSRLVLATGAQPIRLALQGNAADWVRSINSLDDFSGFFSDVGPHVDSADSSENHSKTIVIMGAGLIGCEFANDLRLGGHQVHLVDPAPRPLAALLPEGAALQLQDALGQLGVTWHLGASVQSVEHGSGNLQVLLSDGSTVTADVVLSAIGLRADTALAAAAGLVCERGVVVDDVLQTSANGVFALGDCAQYASAGQRTLPYVMPIMNAARALAATLAGTPTPLAFPLMPVSVKTPALPTVVAPPHPALQGQWVASDEAEPGWWRFVDGEGAQRGFALTGKQTARRMEQTKLTQPS